MKILKSAAKYFVGTHDFAGFAANRGKPERTTIRTINSVRVRQKGPCVTIEFDGDGFLYKMVRLMVGALVKCALGKMRIEEITSRLHSGKSALPVLPRPPKDYFSSACATDESGNQRDESRATGHLEFTKDRVQMLFHCREG